MEQPYIIKSEVVETRSYNPLYGDLKICECGHEYYRHFDSYFDSRIAHPSMDAVGCKYCQCDNFKEVK